jgi:hypothetical protein
VSTSEKSLGVLLLKTVGGGLSSLNSAGSMKDLEIIEFSPLGAQSQLLVLGAPKVVSRLIVDLRTADIERSMILPHFDEKILRSYLGLEISPLKNFTLVIESSFVGELFQCVGELLQLGLSIVDFRLIRSTGSPGHVILTGEDFPTAEKWIEDYDRKTSKRGPCQISFQQNLSDGYRKYMDL